MNHQKLRFDKSILWLKKIKIQKLVGCLILLLFALSQNVQAQKSTLRTSVYFESNSAELDSLYQARLDGISDSLQNKGSIRIYLRGNTDDQGDSLFNLDLSQKRVKSVRDYFLSKGFPDSVFIPFAYGEEKPIADNSEENGRSKNRRVDILIQYELITITLKKEYPVSLLYDQLATEYQKFSIDPLRDTIIRGIYGTIIQIPAGSFSNGRSRCREPLVEFRLKEDFLKSDMLRDRLVTQSNGRILETMGMIYMDAFDCKGRSINIEADKGLTILMPTDQDNSEAKLFNGVQEGHDEDITWTLNNNSYLNNYCFRQLNFCSILGNCERLCAKYCVKCPFFFCRLSRFNKPFQGMFNKQTRKENREFRACQRNLRNPAFLAERDSNRRLLAQLLDSMEKEPELSRACDNLDSLKKQYGVTSNNDLVLALNKSLLDSFKVDNMTELRDTLKQVNLANFEMAYRNKRISFQDYRFYVFNTSRLGWKNADIFANIPEKDKVTFKVDLKKSKEYDCKLVFQNRDFVLNLNESSGTEFQASGLPRGEKVWLVVLSYSDQTPKMYLKEFVLDDMTVSPEFKVYGLEELKEALKVLDNEDGEFK